MKPTGTNQQKPEVNRKLATGIISCKHVIRGNNDFSHKFDNQHIVGLSLKS